LGYRQQPVRFNAAGWPRSRGDGELAGWRFQPECVGGQPIPAADRVSNAKKLSVASMGDKNGLCMFVALRLRRFLSVEAGRWPYFGGAGVNPSRRWLGSGFGLGFGAFLASFLPLSLLPMIRSVTQEGSGGKEQIPCLLLITCWSRLHSSSQFDMIQRCAQGNLWAVIGTTAFGPVPISRLRHAKRVGR